MANSRRNQGGRSNKHVGTRQLVDLVDEYEAVERLESMEDPLVLVLDGIQDPHNLGACLRSAAAAGVDFVFAPIKHTASVTETVRKISTGGADHVPFIKVGNLGQLLENLKKAGLWIVGTGDEESQLLYEVDMKGPLAIVMGSEAKGVREKIAEKCDYLVRIPMIGKMDCLNLSVATGVCLFEAVRQRL